MKHEEARDRVLGSEVARDKYVSHLREKNTKLIRASLEALKYLEESPVAMKKGDVINQLSAALFGNEGGGES